MASILLSASLGSIHLSSTEQSEYLPHWLLYIGIALPLMEYLLYLFADLIVTHIPASGGLMPFNFNDIPLIIFILAELVLLPLISLGVLLQLTPSSTRSEQLTLPWAVLRF